MASWHLVTDGTVRSGGAAAAPLLRLLPGGRPLASIAAPAPGCSASAYRPGGAQPERRRPFYRSALSRSIAGRRETTATGEREP